MIIFYSKKTGEIKGTIDGRIHSKDHLKMWLGDKKEVDRLVIDWKQTGKETEREVLEKKWIKTGKNKHGEDVGVLKIVKSILKVKDYEPQTDQKDIFIKLDRQPRDIYNYKVDVKTKKLVK